MKNHGLTCFKTFSILIFRSTEDSELNLVNVIAQTCLSEKVAKFNNWEEAAQSVIIPELLDLSPSQGWVAQKVFDSIYETK